MSLHIFGTVVTHPASHVMSNYFVCSLQSSRGIAELGTITVNMEAWSKNVMPNIDGKRDQLLPCMTAVCLNKGRNTAGSRNPVPFPASSQARASLV